MDVILPIEKISLDILKEYNGTNDYILNLLNEYKKSKTFVLTRKQAEYIKLFHNVQPIELNRYVQIHLSCREFVQQQLGLDEKPERIYVNKLLSRKSDMLHFWGCVGEDSKKYQMIYVAKECLKKLKTVPELDFSGYTREPKPHQIVAITKLLENEKYILGDQMGLGKTTSAIIAAVVGKFERILVVCPASLKINWKKEIMNYDKEENISIVDGNFRMKKWTIVNYDVLKNYHYLPQKGVSVEELTPSAIDFYKFDLVIADESHYLKNSTSSRTKIFIDFASRIPNRWFLTGTPITNKPIDFYTLLYLCDSPIATNWMHYVKRYCAGRQIKRPGTNKKFWLTSGASNLDELRDYSADVMLRRTKKDSIDLPQKTIKPIYLPLDFSASYNEYLRENETWVESTEEKPTITEHLTKLVKIRQLLSNDKIKHTIEIAEDLIENDQKVIIFSCFTNTIKTIHEHFGKASVLIDGSVTSKKRDEAVIKFQTDPKIKVFCGNIVAAGVGLTLTEGSVVIFNDLDWTPANHAQAEDRSHRMGQTKPVHIIYPLFDETLDTIMYETLQRKMKIINQIMGDDMKFDDNSMAKDIIQSLKS
jgi:SWI/SNF-related matrix-associated actin-dependent regulator 1 of chromatin subfamily A